MEVKIVLGLNFGDEGKGMVVQNLCKQALAENKRVLVVRFSGGPQAAHTVVHNGMSHICSTYGSGCLLGVPTLWMGTNTAIDPISFINERHVLQEKGIDPPIWFFRSTTVITPYDVIHNQNDPESLSHGTCGKGVWASHNRSTYFGLHQATDSYERSTKLNMIRFNYGDMPRRPGLEHRFKKACDEMSSLIVHDYSLVDSYDVIIYEGSQGLLLDPQYSPFKPHVTATSLLGFSRKTGAEVYLVTRSYLTRHGNGYEPKKCEDFYDLSEKFETNEFNEFQGEFKTGVLSIDLMNRIIDRTGLNDFSLNFNLVVTHMDIPFTQNKFMYELGNQIHTFKEEGKEVDPYNVCHQIADNLYLDIKNIYYTNSPNSNLHLCM